MLFRTFDLQVESLPERKGTKMPKGNKNDPLMLSLRAEIDSPEREQG